MSEAGALTSLDVSANHWPRENREGAPTAVEPGCTALDPLEPQSGACAWPQAGASKPHGRYCLEELQDETVSGKHWGYV